MFAVAEAFTIRESRRSGRGIFAQRPLPSGTLFWKERPLAAVSKQVDDGLRCDHCFVLFSGKQLKRFQLPDAAVDPSSVHACAGHDADESCGTLSRYCSADCKTQSYEAHHSIVCKLGQPGERLLEYCAAHNVRYPLIARDLVAGSLLSGKEFMPYWARINALCYATPLEEEGDTDVKDPSWEEEYGLLAEAYRYVLGEDAFTKIFSTVLDYSFYEALMRRLHINMMRLSSPSHAPAIALFHTASLLNHSCVPNVTVDFSCGEATFSTSRDVETGEELSLCYLAEPDAMSVEDRVEELYTNYGFRCNCPMCAPAAN
eukprot:g2555.t1